MNNKKIIIKNVFSSIIYQVVTIIYGFIVPILIIKKFGSETNGLISSIAQFLAYISLLEGGIGPVIKNALYKPLVKKDKKQIEVILSKANRFFKNISYVFLIYILILCFVYPKFINNNFSTAYTISLILIISVNYFSEYFLGMSYTLFLKSDQKNYVVDNLNSISYIVNLFMVIILIKLNFNIQVVKLCSAIIYIIKPIILRLYFNKKYNYKISNNSTYKFKKQNDGLIHHIASTVQSSTDIILLTIFSDMANISIYSVYSLVTNGIKALIVSLTNGIDAFFGKLLVSSEGEHLINKFSIYNYIFYTITTILLSSTLILIIPFISIYTQNISDANYVIPVFAYILVFAEFMFVIRYPYSSLVYAKGYFKETRLFSIIEPLVNLLVSILLVKKLGLIGVAIGTLVSMPIRSFGFIYCGSVKILKVKFSDSLKLIMVSFMEMLLIFAFHLLIGNFLVSNYFQWLLLAVIVLFVSTFFICSVNILIFKKDFKELISILKVMKNER